MALIAAGVGQKNNGVLIQPCDGEVGVEKDLLGDVFLLWAPRSDTEQSRCVGFFPPPTTSLI